MTNYFFKTSLFILVILLVTGCNSTSVNNKSQKIITVHSQSQQTQLFFTGYVQPIQVSTCISPLGGTVTNSYFSYGQPIKKGQLLLTIISDDYTKNYQDAVTNYLTSKQKYMENKELMTGTEYLYEKQLISRNDYLDAVSNLQDANLTYIQARIQLETLLKLMNLPKNDIELLKIGQTSAIQKALNKSIGELSIYAKASGIALIPPKEDSDNQDNSNNEIQAGSQIKSGQELVTVGDMSGIALEIAVDEININQIKPGLTAIVTSAAFPNITLHGYLKSVSAQADIQSSTNGLPTFSVLIEVPHLTTEQRAQIHVGMNAQIAILINHPAVISLPIHAVWEKNGTFANILNKKTGKIIAVPVKTGLTSLTNVVITRGLLPGDQVVISN